MEIRKNRYNCWQGPYVSLSDALSSLFDAMFGLIARIMQDFCLQVQYPAFLESGFSYNRCMYSTRQLGLVNEIGLSPTKLDCSTGFFSREIFTKDHLGFLNDWALIVFLVHKVELCDIKHHLSRCKRHKAVWDILRSMLDQITKMCSSLQTCPKSLARTTMSFKNHEMGPSCRPCTSFSASHIRGLCCCSSFQLLASRYQGD